MFWNQGKLGELERSLAEAARREAALNDEIATLKRDLAVQAAERREKEMECDTLRDILRNLALFGESLGSSQASLGDMAALLRQEKQ